MSSSSDRQTLDILFTKVMSPDTSKNDRIEAIREIGNSWNLTCVWLLKKILETERDQEIRNEISASIEQIESVNLVEPKKTPSVQEEIVTPATDAEQEEISALKKILSLCNKLAGVCLIAALVFWPYMIFAKNWVAMASWIFFGLCCFSIGRIRAKDFQKDAFKDMMLAAILAIFLGPANFLFHMLNLLEDVIVLLDSLSRHKKLLDQSTPRR